MTPSAAGSPTLRRIGCLAHARRYQYQAVRDNLSVAVWFISQIRVLYRIEDEIRGHPPAKRQARRQERAPALWDALKAKAQGLQPPLLPQSTLGKALNFFLNEYDVLTGYLREGRFVIQSVTFGRWPTANCFSTRARLLRPSRYAQED